jgi:beta-galactosidase
VDEKGNVKRQNNDVIRFEIEGEGNIIGNAETMANPIKVEWGTAPVLIQSTTKAGKIKVKASLLNEGINSPRYGEISFYSVSSQTPLLFNEEPDKMKNERYQATEESNKKIQQLKRKVLELEKEINDSKLKDVEKQQQDFEGGKI